MFSLEFCCICVKKYPHLESINETDDNNTKYIQKLLVCVPDQVSFCSLQFLFMVQNGFVFYRNGMSYLTFVKIV